MEESLCRIGDGGITGNDTLLRQFCGYNNLAWKEIKMAIMSVDKHSKSDDSAWGNYPEAPITLVVGQRDYSVPVANTGLELNTFLRLNKIWVADASGNRTELTQMDIDEDFVYTNGTPTKYRLHGSSIFLNIPPNASSVTLYVLFQRANDDFLYDDTTREPGFLVTYHDLIPLRASSFFMLPTDPALSTLYEQRYLARLELLKRDIVLLDDNTPRRLTPAYENNR